MSIHFMKTLYFFTHILLPMNSSRLFDVVEHATHLYFDYPMNRIRKSEEVTTGPHASPTLEKSLDWYRVIFTEMPKRNESVKS